MWPQVYDLSVGQPCTVHTAGGRHTLTLRGFTLEYQPDLWSENNASRRVIVSARVDVEVDGQAATLQCRPFQMPQVAGALQLYVESVRPWAVECHYAALEDLTADVRLAILDADTPWGPPGLVFPVPSYRSGAVPYRNTWNALVPNNRLYYHRGEDFGAMPDVVEVRAIEDGEVIECPVGQPKGSNPVRIRHPDGHSWMYAHMNIESIDPSIRPGAFVHQGDVIGRTGCTWDGRHAQWMDPHLHVELDIEGRRRSPYPFLTGAYLAACPEPILAVAGGYAYAVPGDRLQLDATRSLARPGRRIVSFTWHLHTGETVPGPRAVVEANTPGLYDEVLSVAADDGTVATDVCHVRVWDPAAPRDCAWGWIYHHPMRGNWPGQPIRFFNRILGFLSPAEIDYGDGSPAEPIDQETEHTFANPGCYRVAVSGMGPRRQPMLLKMPVVVDAGS